MCSFQWISDLINLTVRVYGMYFLLQLIDVGGYYLYPIGSNCNPFLLAFTPNLQSILLLNALLANFDGILNTFFLLQAILLLAIAIFFYWVIKGCWGHAKIWSCQLCFIHNYYYI